MDHTKSHNNKLKVAWICHFNNQEIQTKFGINKGWKEFAPWVTYMIKELKKREDIILHIIAPAHNIIFKKSFKDDNIYYHFYPIGIPFRKKNWPVFFRFDLWTGYALNTLKIVNIIKKLDIDLVNLIGAENAYYSGSILKIHSLPRMVTIQGFIGLSKFKNKSKNIQTRIKTETKILQSVRNFGHRTKYIKDIIREYNRNANFYEFSFPMPEIEINENKKTFDIIFFARISKNKGIEDLINAMVKVKKYIPDVSLKVAGNTNKNYLNYLHKLVENNDLKDNIEFVGFLPTRLDVMNLASNARICALPTYNDIRPGTVVESMNVGVPVVAYNVGAIPEINKKEKCISLVKVGDIKGLSKAIIEILTDNELRKTLSKNGKDYIQRTFNNKVEMDKLVTAYNDIIKNFEKN